MEGTLMSDKSYFIHPSSFVEDDACIGKGTSIWHFCHVFKGARIGENCKIGQNVVIHSTAVIGNNAKIQNNVSVYDGVVLEDNVFCGPSCVFTNIINPRCAVPRNSPGFYKKTLVRHDATIGANATIVCGVTIGSYALIGAGAVVTKDVEDYELVCGVPACRIGWVCACGETLKFFRQKSECCFCHRKYRKVNNKVCPA